MDIKLKLKGALKSVTVWVNGLFLAAVPFADQIITSLMTGVRDHLPELQPYLPNDWFTAVSAAIVIFNIYQRTRTSMSLAEKGAK